MLNLNQVRNIFWAVFGMFIFMPIEIFYDGLYLSYFQIIILLFFTKRISKIAFLIFLGFLWSVLISVIRSDAVQLTTIINPILIGVALILTIQDKNQLHSIKLGIYFAAIGNTFALLFLAYHKNITNIFVLMGSRVWAIPEIPYFGNGLAMLFSAAMIFAYKENKYKLLFFLFIGGLLTTSRIPIFIFLLLIFFLVIRAIKLNIFYGLIIFIFTTASIISIQNPEFFNISTAEMDSISARISTTEDRIEVYHLALSQIYEHPFFGIGSTKLDYYEHAHNSYLQIALKFGIVGFILWIILVYLAFFKNSIISENIGFLLLFLIISTSQIGLLNPNLVLMLLIYRWIFMNCIPYVAQKNIATHKISGFRF